MTTGLRDLELAAIEQHTSDARSPAASADELLLRLALTSVAMARAAKLQALATNTKEDDSPVTEVDYAVEARVRELVAATQLDLVVVGEEQGGTLPATGPSLAVDPIDGTWAFLNASARFATSIALFQGREVTAAAVANPSTGEVIYSTGDRPRLLRLRPLPTDCTSRSLPEVENDRRPLVHIHPARSAGPLVESAFAAWSAGRLTGVELEGGSPAWAIAECARGRICYVNLWNARQTEPYDLAAAVALLRGAGGDVVDGDGAPIDALSHRGPFVAGLSDTAREATRAVLASAVGTSPPA
jgi:myo-inositol-1(or 4)-monophosphatase